MEHEILRLLGEAKALAIKANEDGAANLGIVRYIRNAEEAQARRCRQLPPPVKATPKPAPAPKAAKKDE
jgi:hypothetical protein